MRVAPLVLLIAGTLLATGCDFDITMPEMCGVTTTCNYHMSSAGPMAPSGQAPADTTTRRSR